MAGQRIGRKRTERDGQCEPRKPVVAAATLTLLGAALCWAVASATEAPLDEDFLEYLAEFETGADDWSWFADAEENKPEVASSKPANQPKPASTPPPKPAAPVKPEEKVEP